MLTNGIDDKMWSHKLKVRRTVLDIRQTEAAENIGVQRKTYQRWESGENVPTLENRKAITKAFECDGEDIFGEGWENESWNGED